MGTKVWEVIQPGCNRGAHGEQSRPGQASPERSHERGTAESCSTIEAGRDGSSSQGGWAVEEIGGAHSRIVVAKIIIKTKRRERSKEEEGERVGASWEREQREPGEGECKAGKGRRAITKRVRYRGCSHNSCSCSSSSCKWGERSKRGWEKEREAGKWWASTYSRRWGSAAKRDGRWYGGTRWRCSYHSHTEYESRDQRGTDTSKQSKKEGNWSRIKDLAETANEKLGIWGKKITARAKEVKGNKVVLCYQRVYRSYVEQKGDEYRTRK